MNRSVGRFRFVLAMTAWLGATAGLAVAASKNAAEEAIRAQTAAWEKAYNAADSKAAGATFVLNKPTEVGVSGKKDGKWHYIRDTWNADAPAAPPPPPAPAAAPAAPPKK